MSHLWPPLRRICPAPGFAVPAIVILALTLGVNIAIFTAVDGAILRPLPFPHADRLVFVWNDNVREHIRDDLTSWPTFSDWRAENHCFDRMAGYAVGQMTLTGQGEPRQLTAARVSDQFFEVLGVEPLLGRWLRADEHEYGRNDVVVISYGLFAQFFGSDPSVLGRSIRLNGKLRRIVGVMPPDFGFPARVDLYFPMVVAGRQRANRSAFWLTPIARLKAGMTISQAQADLSTLNEQIAARFADGKGYGVNVAPMHDWLLGRSRAVIWALWGAALSVLVIGCANVANLLLVRTFNRRREFAVRAALGASRWRIAALVLSETAWVGFAGGILALLLADWTLSLLSHYAATTLPWMSMLHIDRTALLGSVVLAGLTCLGASIIPAVSASGADPQVALRSGNHVIHRHQGTTQSVFAIVQTTLATVLLIGTGLLLRSMWDLERQDTGLKPVGLVAFSVNTSTEAVARIRQRLMESPGVDAVEATSSVLLPASHDSAVVTVEGRPPGREVTRVEATFDTITPGYFAAVGVPIVAGRPFFGNDGNSSARVAIVNETMAKALWPGGNPLGRRFIFGRSPPPDAQQWITVVGVVSDTRRVSPDRRAGLESWLPVGQTSASAMTLVVRTPLAAAAMAGTVRRAVWSVDPTLPAPLVRPMAEIYDAYGEQRRVTLKFVLVFAAFATVLAAFGTYAVLACAVEQRRKEFGVRLAVGADHRSLLGLVMRRAAMLAGIGGMAAIPLAFWLAESIRASLYGVEPADLATYATVMAVTLASAQVAAISPALKALRLDPMEALRHE